MEYSTLKEHDSEESPHPGKVAVLRAWHCLRAMAAGPVVSEGPISARRGSGLEIQGPQCAFESSKFMCSAVHMSTGNFLRSSSIHETTDPPFRVVSLFADWRLSLRTDLVP